MLTLLGSTRTRLAGALIGVMVVAIAAALVATRALLAVDLENRITDALVHEQREFRRFLEAEPDQGANLLRAGREYLAHTIPDQGEAIILLVEGAGAVRSAGAPYDLDRDPALRARWRDLATDELRTIATPAGDARLLAVPVTHSGRRTGTLVVTNFLDQERSEVDRALWVVIQVAAGAIVLVGLFAWTIAGQVLRPLAQMTDTARRISEEDISRRLREPRVRDEVGVLVRTFNGMLDRLEGALDAKREFLADSGHELRTPMTIVRGHVEQLIHGLVPAEEVEETLVLVGEEVNRMSRMIDDLVLLAQSEQREFLDLGPVDLGDLAIQVRRRAESFAGPVWRTEPGHGVVRADGERITQAALNLITNAARYSPPGEPITIGTRLRGADWAEIWVADSGPGLPSDLIQTAHHRLVKGTDRRRSGLGLGLAIAHAIAEAHGGRLDIANAAPRGARIALVIPRGGPT